MSDRPSPGNEVRCTRAPHQQVSSKTVIETHGREHQPQGPPRQPAAFRGDQDAKCPRILCRARYVTTRGCRALKSTVARRRSPLPSSPPSTTTSSKPSLRLPLLAGTVIPDSPRAPRLTRSPEMQPGSYGGFPCGAVDVFSLRRRPQWEGRTGEKTARCTRKLSTSSFTTGALGAARGCAPVRVGPLPVLL